MYQDNWRWCNKCQGLAYAGKSHPKSSTKGRARGKRASARRRGKNADKNRR
jgi:hypothetical protein